ncbi:hypothetical protein CUMW_248010 [Citrus unshiu]|uniref:Uncharacterized protein n=1 Tax=Citrus unshiu TaxID=55188 RepID=A0A2H5QQ05_CITUN|nr:hypothetical protein CUMW_248010 [Citrus unshiu]
MTTNQSVIQPTIPLTPKATPEEEEAHSTMHMIQGLKESNVILESNSSCQSDSKIISFSIPLQPDSFAELQAKDDKVDLEPKSPTTIHAINGSTYDYLKKPENGEIARIVEKVMQMTLNELHFATIYGCSVLDFGGEAKHVAFEGTRLSKKKSTSLLKLGTRLL